MEVKVKRPSAAFQAALAGPAAPLLLTTSGWEAAVAAALARQAVAVLGPAAWQVVAGVEKAAE